MRTTIASILGTLALNACCAAPSPRAPVANKVAPKPLEPTPPADTPVTLASVGLDADAMDRNANPCEDFYQFACGGWEAKTVIPNDKPRWNRSFSEIHKRNQADLRAILDAAKTAETDTDERKIGDFYAACMNQEAADKASPAMVQSLMQYGDKFPRDASWLEIGTDKDGGLVPRLAALHDQGIYPFFDITGDQDPGDATKVIAHIDQNGLGMPDRDYYLAEDAKSKELLIQYQTHVTSIFGLAGLSVADATAAAQAVVEIETRIAKISKTRVERRDPKKMYNKIDREGLKQRSQVFKWEMYLNARGLNSVKDINVTSVPFVEGLNELLKAYDSKGGKAKIGRYLQWTALNAYASDLSAAFFDQNFKFTKVLTGQPAPQARWKRCIAATDQALGEILAQPYVAKRFGPASKSAVEQMVSEIGAAFNERLDQLPWMDPRTRGRARTKLKKMAYLIGYPASWRKYPFSVSPEQHAFNVKAASEFEILRQLRKIGKPIDREEWHMTPQTVNAYYNPPMNQMVFPAGILQPPFFNPDANIAVNLGGMGMVVGHELTHGFDDQGSQYDANGDLKSWWEPATRDRFEERTQCIDTQYASYEPLPGVKLNGKLTMGENIADAGGVKLAYRAFRRLRDNATDRVVAEGLTEDQQFFVSVGQIWCSKYREEFARLKAKNDPHSPPKFRVNGSLRNTREFHDAFKCEAPTDACEIW